MKCIVHTVIMSNSMLIYVIRSVIGQIEAIVLQGKDVLPPVEVRALTVPLP